MLCAGVTVYKGLKETEAKPGEWVAIAGIGGLGHMAVQYAKAMGLHVVAIDVAEDKLALARSLGADAAIDAPRRGRRRGGPPRHRWRRPRRAGHRRLPPPAFAQALAMTRCHGTMAMVGLPPGGFPLPIFDMVLNRVTVRGSIVGTRQDLV